MNCTVVRWRLHGRCCCPPPELLFALPGWQLFQSFPPLLPLWFPFIFALLLPRQFSCPPPFLFWQLWCWLWICYCGWNRIWYVDGGTRLVIAWHTICACCSCCYNCVLVGILSFDSCRNPKKNHVPTAHKLYLILWWLYQLRCLQNHIVPPWLRKCVWDLPPCSKKLLLRSMFFFLWPHMSIFIGCVEQSTFHDGHDECI